MASPETPHVPVLPPPRFFFGVSVGLTVFFILWTWLVHGSALPAFDMRCAQYWHDWSAQHRGVWGLMVFLTDIGGIASMAMLAIMGAIWQTAIGHRTVALAWLLVMVGGAILNQGTKELVGRPRPQPPLPDRAVLETNASYPSGHSMTSAMAYGMLGYALILPQRRRPRRVAALLLMAALILAVGFSRIYLRAHWFSDVIGGWTMGLAWLFFCLGWLERRRLRAVNP